MYVPEDENTSKSVEIERMMRESRLRELVKGVYSSSYGDAIASKVQTSVLCTNTYTIFRSKKVKLLMLI